MNTIKYRILPNNKVKFYFNNELYLQIMEKRKDKNKKIELYIYKKTNMYRKVRL